MSNPDWAPWHRKYDEADSTLSRRLALVQGRIRDHLDQAPPGPIRVISVCAGQGRDLVGAAGGHARGGDLVGRLVELDPTTVADARRRVSEAGLSGLEVIEGDASLTNIYAPAVPADLALVCGVFGNITDADVKRTIDHLPSLCAEAATVIWTRHRGPPDPTPAIRRWFGEAGFAEVGFDGVEGSGGSVGAHRLTGPPQPFRPDVRLFDFVGYGQPANL